jgi:hypothetical protein
MPARRAPASRGLGDRRDRTPLNPSTTTMLPRWRTAGIC